MSRSSTGRKLNTGIGIAVIFGIVIFGNVVANRINLRLDITDEKLYTLSEGTHAIIKSFDDVITLKLYYSRSLEGIPPQFKNYARRVEELLEEYPLHGKNISLEVIDPEPDTEAEEMAQRYGIQGHPLAPGINFYFGLIASGIAGEEVIAYFDERRENFLEYDITRSIYLVGQQGKPTLGILSGLKILGDTPPPPQFGAPPPKDLKDAWMFTSELKKIYAVEEISSTAESIDPSVDLLLVVYPKDLSEKTQYAIDQHLLNGKNVIFFVDPLYMNEQAPNRFAPPEPDTSLDRLFDAWGVAYKPEEVLADPIFASPVRSPEGVVKHPAWLSLTQASVNPDEVVTGELSQLLMLYPGQVGLKSGIEEVSFTPLLSTSNRAKSFDKSRITYSQANQLMSDLSSGGEKYSLAGLFKGSFKSAFSKAPEGVSGEHLTKSKTPGAVIVVADVDMLEDQYCLQPIQIFGQVVGYEPLNQNTFFLANTVEMMSGNKDLISLRSRGKFVRPFDKVVELEADARSRFQEEEKNLQSKLQELETQINQRLQGTDASNQAIVTATVQAELEKFREERLKISRKLREVKRNLRGDIESLGTNLKVINILGMPVLIGILGLLIATGRTRRFGR